MKESSSLLLDTCALLWLAEGGGPLSRQTVKRIDDAAVVSVCAISGFEIGLKYSQGKLKLPAPPEDWLSAILEHHHVAMLSLDLQTCVRAAQLPAFHRDPADRLIIATALAHRVPVVTHDPRFADYGVEVLG